MALLAFLLIIAIYIAVKTKFLQVVTTSLQFDPANPSVLYTADGTLINQADLSPEEQALVQAALQQHLAEQEAEQQLALIEQVTKYLVVAL